MAADRERDLKAFYALVSIRILIIFKKVIGSLAFGVISLRCHFASLPFAALSLMVIWLRRHWGMFFYQLN